MIPCINLRDRFGARVRTYTAHVSEQLPTYVPASADSFQASKSASTPFTPVLALSFSSRAMIVRRMGSGQSFSTHFFCFSSSVISFSGSLASRSIQSALAPSPSSSLSLSHHVYLPGMFFLRILSSRSAC